MTYAAQYQRLGLFAMIDLKGSQDALQDWSGAVLPAFPDQPNTRVSDGTRCLAHIGPSHWLLWDILAEETALIDALTPADAPADISIVPVSDAYTRFRLTGPDAWHIMSIASPLDVHPSVFAENACSFTEVFSLTGLVWRSPDGFEFAVDSSFGDMVSDYLDRAIGTNADR